MTFDPDFVEDYWALLLEKAFAKFVGGYMKLEGGHPRLDFNPSADLTCRRA